MIGRRHALLVLGLFGCGGQDPGAALDRAIDDLAGSLLGDELRILVVATLVIVVARWGRGASRDRASIRVAASTGWPR